MSDLQTRLDRLAILILIANSAVRVKCKPCDGSGLDFHDRTCPRCHGAGFTGSRDLAVWLEMAGEEGWSTVLFTAVPRGDTAYGRGRYSCVLTDPIGVTIRGLGKTHLDSLLSALEKAKHLGPLDTKEK